MLQWLIDRASRVYDWFSDFYWTAKDRITNFWTYVTNKAIEWYNNLRLTVVDWINTVYRYISENLTNAYNTVSSWINNRANDLSNWTQNKLNEVISWAQNIYNDARTYAYNIVNDARALVYDKVGWLVSVINEKFNHLQSVANDLGNRISNLPTLGTIITNNITNIMQALSDKYFNQIETFFKDPAGYILSGIWNRFVELFCYAIGYGLGTTTMDLPPIPTWYQGGSGGNGEIPTDKVNKPCTPLWVSGYTFDNPVGHKGTDFGIGSGQAIYAAHNGKVLESGWSSVGYGNYIVISNGTWWSRYAHLQAILVSNGQEVGTGQQIAKGDTTGNSTGNHLHFELKHNGAFVDPIMSIN